MDKKVELRLLSVAGAQNNARIFALIMGEKDGARYFPILVNESEAQSVVVMMQNVKVVRPLVHDVFADFITMSGQVLDEVVIFNVVNGTFYAHLVFQEGGMLEAKAAAEAVAERRAKVNAQIDRRIEAEAVNSLVK